MKRIIWTVMLMLVLGAVTAWGTVTDVTNRITFNCDGSDTTFDFTFPIIDTSDMVVILRTTATGVETALTEVTHYALSATNNDYSSGGIVTTVATYGSAYTLTLLRNVPESQEADLEDSGVLRQEALEDALDRLTLQVQDLEEQLSRALILPRSESMSTELADSVTRANHHLSFGSTGVPTISSSGFTSDDYTVSAFMETLLDDTTAAGARATLDSGGVLNKLALNDYTADLNLLDFETKGPYFDVRAYGADPTGAADSTADFQEALDAADDAGGGVVFVPAGNYLIDTAELTIYSNTILRGAGFNSKLIVTVTRTNIITTDASATDILVEDLWIYGSGTTNTDERGVFGDSATRLTVRNCKIENMTVGVHFEGCTGGRVLYCFIKDIVGASATTEGYGVLASSGNSNILTAHCSITDTARHAIYYGATINDSGMIGNNIDGCGEAALVLNTTEAQTVSSNNIITGNTIKNVTSAGNDGHGVVVTTHHYNTIITNNTMETISDYGILITSDETGTAEGKMIHGVIISNNTIIDTVTAIRVNNAQDVQILSNNIRTTSGVGIGLRYAGTSNMSYLKNCTIANNQLHTITGDGIYLAGGTRMSNIILGKNLLTSITGTDLVQTAGMVDFQNHIGLIWHEDVMTYADFDAASTTPTHNYSLVLPAGAIVTEVWWLLDTDFAGGSVSAATLEFGVSGGDVDGYFPAANVFTGATNGFQDSAITSRGALLYDPTGGDRLPLKYFCTAATTLVATLRLTDDNGEDLTAGAVRIYIGYYIASLPTT